eukprot:GEMP01080766.1.p1 GENE.GEMP01080766.1~~GEMP01080766.1.p1  ORF type:complete len:269 (+),score=39.07 GEMP01080766.1:36-809(+)
MADTAPNLADDVPLDPDPPEYTEEHLGVPESPVESLSESPPASPKESAVIFEYPMISSSDVTSREEAQRMKDFHQYLADSNAVYMLTKLYRHLGQDQGESAVEKAREFLGSFIDPTPENVAVIQENKQLKTDNRRLIDEEIRLDKILRRQQGSAIGGQAAEQLFEEDTPLEPGDIVLRALGDNPQTTTFIGTLAEGQLSKVVFARSLQHLPIGELRWLENKIASGTLPWVGEDEIEKGLEVFQKLVSHWRPVPKAND